MAEFAQQLLTDHPKEASRAFVPLLDLLEELLDGAAAAGAIHGGLNHRRIAGVLLQAIMFNAFASTISGSSVRREPGRGRRGALGPRARRHRHALSRRARRTARC